MSDAEAQGYQNHRRVVVGFHVITLGILIVNLIWSLYRTVTRFSLDAVVALLLSVGLMLFWHYARAFATTAQDRIIRVEEQLRLTKLLPPDLVKHIGDYTIGQLIAMRFASDEELPALARRVRAEGIRDREAIKRLIKTWRPDYLRV